MRKMFKSAAVLAVAAVMCCGCGKDETAAVNTNNNGAAGLADASPALGGVYSTVTRVTTVNPDVGTDVSGSEGDKGIPADSVYGYKTYDYSQSPHGANNYHTNNNPADKRTNNHYANDIDSTVPVEVYGAVEQWEEESSDDEKTEKKSDKEETAKKKSEKSKEQKKSDSKSKKSSESSKKKSSEKKTNESSKKKSSEKKTKESSKKKSSEKKTNKSSNKKSSEKKNN